MASQAPAKPRQSEEKWVEDWFSKVKRGEKAKEAWENQYEPKRCKDYWKGNQLDEPLDSNDQRRMQVNKIHPRVRASLPSIYFAAPVARVEMRPAVAQTPGQAPGISIDDRQAILANTANTFIQDTATNIITSSYDCLKESYWAFGCVRVRFDAIPADNPRALAPELKQDGELGDSGESQEESLSAPGGPPSIPGVAPVPQKRFGEILGLSEDTIQIAEERFYAQRIPSRQVIWSADQSGNIEEMPWVGYWSISYVEDVKEAGRRGYYKNTEELKSSGVRTGEDPEEEAGASTDDPSSKPGGGKVKLYHIWDQRARRYIVLADDHKKRLLYQKYKRRPLFFLRRDVDPDEFAPIPPIYHQLSLQDEANHSREWLRLNRNGTVARFTYDDEAVTPADMKKLEKGQMGTYIPRRPNTVNPIIPIQHPNYSQVAVQTAAMTDQDFSETAIQGDEQRGVPRSKTATQAKIVDVRSQVQESFDRKIMGKFIAEIVQEMVMMAIERMSLPLWIKMNADETAAGYGQEAQRIAAMWNMITKDDLGDAVDGYKWWVVIDEESMSPVAEQEAKEEWFNSLQMLGNPAMAALLSMSPELRKISLKRMGIKSAREQELIGEALGIITQMNQSQAMAGGPRPLGMASPPAAQGGPPTPPHPTVPPGRPAPPPGPPDNTRQARPGGGIIRLPA